MLLTWEEAEKYIWNVGRKLGAEDHIIMDAWMSLRAWKHFGLLPPRVVSRDVILGQLNISMRYGKYKTYKEMSEILGVPENEIKIGAWKIKDMRMRFERFRDWWEYEKIKRKFLEKT